MVYIRTNKQFSKYTWQFQVQSIGLSTLKFFKRLEALTLISESVFVRVLVTAVVRLYLSNPFIWTVITTGNLWMLLVALFEM